MNTGMANRPNSQQLKHWEELRGLGSILTQTYPVEICHCHGGSIIDTFGYGQNPGWAQKQNHWLVIPLTQNQHQGTDGLDSNVRAWEATHHTQVMLLEWICHLTGTNVFERAGLEHEFQAAYPWDVSEKP